MMELPIIYLHRKSVDWFLYDRNLCHERVKTAIFYVSRGAISKAHHSKKRFSKKMVDETGMKSEKEGGENAVKKMMSLTENIFNLKFCS